MTRSRPSAQPPMEELDLDSFLRRHNADSESDSDVPRRTVDDILNDSDASSSPSSSPPSSRAPLSSSRDNVDSLSALKTLNSSDKPSSSTQLKHNLIQRFKSDEVSGRKPPLRPPSLFGGGVRTPARPGTALAAAAAASRSITARHVAAIKSRRAMSVNLEGKVSDGDELLRFSRDDLSDRISIGDQADVKSEGGNGGDVHEQVEDRIEGRESAFVDSIEETDGKGSESNGLHIEPRIQDRESASVLDSNVETPNMASSEDVIDQLGNDKSAIAVSDDLEKTGSEHSADRAGGSSLEVEIERTEAVLDSELDVAKDDLRSISDDDVAELVEDTIAQLESEIATRIAEEKVQPVKKPLELAEELEIKQASTGLHLEEGAAAQPMRLEGVRRGSTVLGYFDTDSDNTITRTIKSQIFRRDYGIPQVLAVHLNYIAFGTSKGIIVVLPSKYSPHHPDNMDAKVYFLS